MKLSDAVALGTDSNARWFNHATGEMVDGPVDGAWCLLIGPQGSRRSQRVLGRGLRLKRGEADKDGRLRGDALDSVNVSIATEGVLLDWAGLEDDDGEPIECSAAKAAELIDGPLPDLLEDVANWGLRVAAEVARERKDAEGNSEAGSGGN